MSEQIESMVVLRELYRVKVLFLGDSGKQMDTINRTKMAFPIVPFPFFICHVSLDAHYRRDKFLRVCAGLPG